MSGGGFGSRFTTPDELYSCIRHAGRGPDGFRADFGLARGRQYITVAPYDSVSKGFPPAPEPATPYARATRHPRTRDGRLVGPGIDLRPRGRGGPAPAVRPGV